MTSYQDFLLAKPTTLTDRRILALKRKAKKYPKCKPLIESIRRKRAWQDHLAR